MSVGLTPQQQTVVDALAASGRYAGEHQVLDEALELLRQRDDLRERLQEGVDPLDRGERRPMADVFADIRRTRAASPVRLPKSSESLHSPP